MSKRLRSNSPDSPSSAKKWRPELPNFFDKLSDELVLKVLSFLPISDLARSQQVSYRFFRIAGDGQIWKSAFYHHFVQPRVSRLRGQAFPSGGESFGGEYSSIRDLRWLEDEGFSRMTHRNWKKFYKLRYNWDRGACGVSEVDISTSAGRRIFAKMWEGIVFTVDKVNGLRAWETGTNRRLLAKARLPTTTGNHPQNEEPTAIAIDESGDRRVNSMSVNAAVGFQNGAFGIYRLDLATGNLTMRYLHQSTDRHQVTTMAFYDRNLAMMSSADVFRLYYIDSSKLDQLDCSTLEPLKLITTLKSHTVWPPHSLSIRKSSNGIYVCIIYALPLHTMGWSAGIQELRLTSSGNTILQCRIASAVYPGFQSTLSESQPGSPPYSSSNGGVASGDSSLRFSQPTSFSYTHPYLLAAHRDNTLTLYLVKSTTDTLEMSPGQQLWGHTSSISGVQVGSHGKAVSISSRGSEIRIWDLEGSNFSSTSIKSAIAGASYAKDSVKLSASPSQPENHGTQILGGGKSEALSTITTTSVSMGFEGDKYLNRWLGFDEEKVIVHREKFDAASQVLMVYDFT